MQPVVLFRQLATTEVLYTWLKVQAVKWAAVCEQPKLFPPPSPPPPPILCKLQCSWKKESVHASSTTQSWICLNPLTSVMVQRCSYPWKWAYPLFCKSSFCSKVCPPACLPPSCLSPAGDPWVYVQEKNFYWIHMHVCACNIQGF